MVVGGDGYRIGRGLATVSRRGAYAVTVGTYLAAGLAAALVVLPGAGDHHPLTVTGWADLTATLVVFAVSVAVANASLYDPYWSVAPAVIVVGWVAYAHAADVPAVPARQAAVTGLLLIWAVRLTMNWARSWPGLHQEDWRYVRLREQTRGVLPWWLVNLAGIQLMPTVVVLVAMLAVWPAVAVRGAPVGPLDALAAVVTVTAILLEATADRQLRRFAAVPANRGAVIEEGLWRHSRHPNYLGEILFWWGMWLFGLAAAPHWWWTVVGPVAMVLLFVTVSVPMMDRRSLERRPGYAAYMRRVPGLVPLPRGLRAAAGRRG